MKRMKRAVFALSAMLLLVFAIGREARAASTSYTCTLATVDYWNLAGEERVVALCSTPTNGISYFAVSASSTNAAIANRFLSMMSTALISKRSVTFMWDTALTPNVSGCGSTNCRTPFEWTLR